MGHAVSQTESIFHLVTSYWLTGRAKPLGARLSRDSANTSGSMRSCADSGVRSRVLVPRMVALPLLFLMATMPKSKAE